MSRGPRYWLHRVRISLVLLFVLAIYAGIVYLVGSAIDDRTGSLAFYGFAVLCTVAGALWQLNHWRAERADPSGTRAKDRRQLRRYLTTVRVVQLAALVLVVVAVVGGIVGGRSAVRGAELALAGLVGLFFVGTVLATGGMMVVLFVRSLGRELPPEAAAHRARLRAARPSADHREPDRTEGEQR